MSKLGPDDQRRNPGLLFSSFDEYVRLDAALNLDPRSLYRKEEGDPPTGFHPQYKERSLWERPQTSLQTDGLNLASVLIISPMSNCSPHQRLGSRALAGDSCPGSCKSPPGSLQNVEVRTYHFILLSSIHQIRFKPTRQINIDLFAL